MNLSTYRGTGFRNSPAHSGWRRQAGNLFSAAAFLLLLFSLAVLIGCFTGHPTRRTTTTSFTAKLPTIPAGDTLQLALPASDFYKLDFMALHGCQLQLTLGKYQSSLGRHASDSQRLLLDLEYLLLAPACIKAKHQEGQIKLATRLQTLQELTQRQLPSRIFNATLASAEYRQYWTGAAIQDSEPEQNKITASALNNMHRAITNWLSGDYRASNIEFEIQLSEIASARIGSSQGSNLHRAVIQLETLQQGQLPTPFRKWQSARHHFFTRHATTTKLN